MPIGRYAAFIIGATVGGLFGLLLAIGYDTSSNVSALEGGQSHLTFAGVLIVGGVFAAIGAGVAEWARRDYSKRRGPTD